MTPDDRWDAAIAALIDDDPDLAVLLIRRQQEVMEFDRFIGLFRRLPDLQDSSLRYVEHPD